MFYTCVSHDVKVLRLKLLVLNVQPAVNPVDEYGALVWAGRWGIHGVTLPGRVTFAPGNVGFSTFGAPRPMEVCEKSILLTSSMCSNLIIMLIFCSDTSHQ